MTNQEIIEALKEEVTLLYNCTDDARMKKALRELLHHEIVDRCKCPHCGNKFDPREEMKSSYAVIHPYN